MATETIVASDGRRLSGRITEHLGKGFVVIEVDGKRYAGPTAAAVARRGRR